ncbi:hypothetical protein OIO90_001579 [Microbotryomycetes sp. JL221]|nr:hypothetical protein OIO90_001579 [Microbotryomycetes sp. JL221]
MSPLSPEPATASNANTVHGTRPQESTPGATTANQGLAVAQTTKPQQPTMLEKVSGHVEKSFGKMLHKQVWVDKGEAKLHGMSTPTGKDDHAAQKEHGKTSNHAQEHEMQNVIDRQSQSA